MQPDQQQTTQQSQDSSTLPYQVPDYLHIDPATGQPSKSHKSLFAGISIVIIIIVIVATSMWLWNVLNPSPEQRLYSALENMLRTSYVHRDITVSRPDSKGLIKIIADSDFSIPDSPKSNLAYTYYGDNKQQSNLVSGELVTINDKSYTGRITSTSVKLPYSLELNKWYTNTLNAPSSSGNADIFGVYTDSNNSVGGVIIGNYSTKKPDRIIELLRSKNIYSIKSAISKNRNGEEFTYYVINEDYKKLNEFVKKVNSDFSLKLTPTTLSSSGNVELLVSNKSGKIIEIIENINQKTFQVRVQTTLSYPNKITIKVPAGAKG